MLPNRPFEFLNQWVQNLVTLWLWFMKECAANFTNGTVKMHLKKEQLILQVECGALGSFHDKTFSIFGNSMQ